MYWLSLFSIIALGITSNGAPHQIKLLNLLTDSGVQSLFEVDSRIEVPEFEMTSPAQVSSNRATRSLPLHRYQRRFTRSPELRDIDPYPQTTELTFNAFGINFHLNLTKSSFIAPDMVLQRGPGGRVINPVDSCYYQGNIIGYEKQNFVTVSTCNGLNGLIRTGDNSYTIKQLPASVVPHFVTEYGDYPHVVFRRSTRSGQRTEVTTSLSRHKRGIRDLDAIITQTIELVVMVDSTVYEYFDSSDTLVQDFVLSFVNALDLLLRNPGLGAYDLNLKLLGIHFFHDSGELEDPEEVTSQTNQCDSGEGCIGELSLMKDLWERVNEGYQADHGIYLTKRKLCFADMTGCQQSGYAPLGGMCGGRSSLSVARADGLQATSEEAHELGHNLGIVHDGEASGGCYDSMHIMSVSQTGTVGNDFTWSTCSAQQLADNLKDDKMSCLDNDSGNYVTIPSDFPGTYLDYDEQCQMLYGTQADGNCNQNKKADFSCERIYCREDPDNKPNLCTDYYPPAEGTPCNTEDNDEGEAYDGWCRIGECLIEGEEPTIDEGEWSDWEEGECSVTCGGGVKLLTRTCNVNDGEEYCKGSDTMYELCNTQLCDGVCSDINADNYRNQFCSSGKAKFYGGDNLCNLYCGSNYEMKVLDGGRQTDDPGKVADLDICIDGQPFTVGCDGSFTSGLVYDRCGVCDGDNSTCTFIDSSFSDISNFSDKELVPIAELIAGTTHITFVESEYVQSAYFVLRTSDGTYLTNSDYTIRPGYTNTGDAGPFRYDPDCNTIFTHNHPYKEVEKIVAPGPISETIDVLYYVKKTSKFQPILFSYYTPTGETDTDDVTQTDQEDADDFANGSQNEDNEVDNNEQEEENDNENELNSAEEENEVEGEAGETGDAEAEDEEGYAEGEAGGEVETEGEAGTEAEEDEDAEEGTEEGEEGEVEEEGTEEGEGDAEEGTEEEEEVEEEEEEGEAEGEAEEEEAEEGTEEEEEEEEEGEAEQNQDDNNGASCTDMTYVRGMAENQEQCDAKKGKRGAYDWVYKLRANEPCKFYCYSEEKEELALFNGGIAEGSWCSNDVLQPKRCIEGDCVDVGCDGEGGGLEFDNCGVCGGNGDTCQLVQASVQLSEDITSITTFPIGASHIYVSERNSNGPKYAKGYYILETSTGSYVTGSNEDGTASEPADKSSAYYYEVGCTAFKHYKWTYESETIESDMPLTEAVELKYQYIDQKSDRFVQYEYYIP